MKENSNSEYRYQDAGELLKEALALWRKEGYLDSDEKNGQFYNIENDPVVKLIMAAFAHQTNRITEEIFRFEDNILNEIIEKVIPYNLIKPVPAFSIIQTTKDKKADYECFASEETPFIFEKEKGKKEAYQFIPLLKIKIINAQISTAKKIDKNKFSVTLVCNEPITDLSGISLYFSKNNFSDLSVSINNNSLPLIKPFDYEKLPFTEWFNIESIFFDKSLLYGSAEYWRDIFVTQNIQIYIVDKYDAKKIGIDKNSIDMVFEFTSGADIDFDANDIKINCVPIVNVEKLSETLSPDKPIKKIADEKSIKQATDNVEEIQKMAGQKQFLNLLASGVSDYKRDAFTLRRFGMERFNRNEFLQQINTIYNRYISDYYVFMDNAGLRDGDKLKKLNLALKDVIDEIKKDAPLNYGIYLILNQSDSLTEQNESIDVSYLLTDGVLANGIKPESEIRTASVIFDKKATQLLRETSGGKDQETNLEIKKNIAQYNFLTKDRLVTKSDIRAFCYKELSSRYSIKKELIEKVEIRNEIESSAQGKFKIILIEIQFKKTTGAIKNSDFSIIENQLKKMIEIRSTNLFPIQVKVFK